MATTVQPRGVEQPLLGVPSNLSNTEDSELELKNIELQLPTARILSKQGWTDVVEEKVDTERGTITICIQGDRTKKHIIITYHDIGMNAVSNFQTFFNFNDMRMLTENFCVYHINAPGQEEGSPNLPDEYAYPTMDELSGQIMSVLNVFEIKRFVGFGVGFGGNVMSRFALNYPDKVDGLCLINCVSTTSGWLEWGYQKLNIRNLRSGDINQGVLDFLLWHHFGKATENRNHDLVQVYKQYFVEKMNASNLGKLMETYINRSDLGLVREMDPEKKKTARMLKMPVLLITGSQSPHVEDTVTLNSRLDPNNASWMKLSDCGMVLEEQPAKVTEAFRYFLQGAGFIPFMQRRISRSLSMSSDTSEPGRKGSLSSPGRKDSLTSPGRKDSMNITENPILEDGRNPVA